MEFDHLTRHLNELFTMAEHHYKKIRKGHEEEAIHKLRVSLKKINAVFKLAAYATPQSFNARLTFGPLKEIFDLSGVVRDLQIANQVLCQYQMGDHENLQKSISDELDLAIGKLLKWKRSKPNGKLFVLVRSSTKPLKSINKAQWLKDSVGYIDRLLQKIEFLMSSHKKDKWHRIRICVKRIRFVMDLALLMKKDFVSQGEYRTVRLLGELLGDWHDRVIVVEKIRCYTIKSTNGMDLNNDKELLKRIGRDRRSLLSASRFYLRDMLTNR